MYAFYGSKKKIETIFKVKTLRIVNNKTAYHKKRTALRQKPEKIVFYLPPGAPGCCRRPRQQFQLTSFTLGGPDDFTHTANGWMNSLSGDLDEFKIFSKELSSDEIRDLYTLQSHGM